MKSGTIGLIPVMFAVTCLKYASIPLYLCFRRCGLLSSVIVMYFWTSEYPSKGIIISTGLVTIGAIIASSDNFDANMVGFLCAFAYNFS